MKFVAPVALALLVCGPSIVVTAQAPRRATPAGPDKPIDIVEAVGCLTAGPNNTWVLTNGSDPVISARAGTTAEAIKEAETKALGKQRYGLIGLNLFDPASHKGHKMAVKGLLIKNDKDTRINVTSFQMAGVTCAN